jgi:hypothetical protein
LLDPLVQPVLQVPLVQQAHLLLAAEVATVAATVLMKEKLYHLLSHSM